MLLPFGAVESGLIHGGSCDAGWQFVSNIEWVETGKTSPFIGQRITIGSEKPHIIYRAGSRGWQRINKVWAEEPEMFL